MTYNVFGWTSNLTLIPLPSTEDQPQVIMLHLADEHHQRPVPIDTWLDVPGGSGLRIALCTHNADIGLDRHCDQSRQLEESGHLAY